MNLAIVCAVIEDGRLHIQDNPPMPLMASLLTVHISGVIKFDQLSQLIHAPLIYADNESEFDFSDASQWLASLASSSPITATNMVKLINRIGSANSLELLLTAANLNTKQALRIGLINEIFTRAEYHHRLEKVAGLSMSAIELAVDISRRAPHLSCMQAETLERYAFALRFSHPDQREGMQAFLEKRRPHFPAQKN